MKDKLLMRSENKVLAVKADLTETQVCDLSRNDIFSQNSVTSLHMNINYIKYSTFSFISRPKTS